MAARRSNKRKRRDRGRFGFLYKLLSIAIILVVIVAGCAVFFRVDQVTVTGESKYTAQEIIEASGVEHGDSLFLLSRGGISRQIYTALPYVDKVNPRRVFPDGLVISVTECVPAAAVRGGEDWWIIASNGKLLEQVPTQPQGLAAVSGITALLPAPGTILAVEEAQRLKLDSLTGLLQALEARGMLDKLSDVDLSGASELFFTYDGRFRVKLPMSCDFPYKARTLEALVGQLQPNHSGSIDLTRDNKAYFDPS